MLPPRVPVKTEFVYRPGFSRALLRLHLSRFGARGQASSLQGEMREKFERRLLPIKTSLEAPHSLQGTFCFPGEPLWQYNAPPMWRALIFLALTCRALGQTPIVRVVSEEVEQHLLKRVPPVYPPLAQQTRISGVVILEISIDESGTPSVRRIIYGHPLLQYAAMDAVRKWTYQPFQSGGKPVRVITFVMVPFGANRPQEDEGRNEMLFQHNFWSAEEAAETALRQGDETGAAQQLSRASALLAASSGLLHEDERAQWMTDMGELCAAQKKYDDAEEYYNKAVKVHQNANKESPGTAAALANLSHFYAEEKKYDLAREHANKSVSIYKKHFKAVGSGNYNAQQTYGNVIAQLSWMLSKIAIEENNHSEAIKQCRTVLDFQKFLGPAEQSSFIPTCQQTVSGLGTKN